MKLSDIFTFLKEGNIVSKLKVKLGLLLLDKKEDLKTLVEAYIKDKAPEAKTVAIEFIAEHIKLGFPLSLFKKTIVKTIDKNFDALVDFIVDKIKAI